jgi:hypothetical protein
MTVAAMTIPVRLVDGSGSVLVLGPRPDPD